jgi:hypothetical protein
MSMGAHIPATDWWCLQSLTLSVNGRVIYDVTLPLPGQWLSTNFALVTQTQLRNHALWRSYSPPPLPQMISGAHLIKQIDGIVGDFIAGPALRSGTFPQPLFWRSLDQSYAVKLNGNGPHTIRAELEFTYFNIQYYGWLNADVEFDLDFSCAGGKLWVVVRNLDMSGYPAVNPTTELNKNLLNAFLQPSLAHKIQSPLQTVTYTDPLGQAACPPVRVVGNSVYLF